MNVLTSLLCIRYNAMSEKHSLTCCPGAMHLKHTALSIDNIREKTGIVLVATNRGGTLALATILFV